MTTLNSGGFVGSRWTAGRVVSPNIVWTYWTQPRATLVGGQLFTGGVDDAGKIFAIQYNPTTSAATTFELIDAEADDHNNPAILAVTGKPVLAFYFRHAVDDLLRIRKGTTNLDVTTLGDEQTVTFSAGVTYAQAFYRGDEVWVFTRTGISKKWSFTHSDDWGDTWDAAQELFVPNWSTNAYMMIGQTPDGTTLRCIARVHPNSAVEAERVVRGFEIDLTTGDISRPSTGAVIGNLDGTDLPLSADDLDVIWTPPTGRSGWVLDVGRGETWEAVTADHAYGVNNDGQYRHHRLEGGQWITTTIAPTGDDFGDVQASFYCGGAQFDPGTEGSVVFVADASPAADGSLWVVERAVRNGDAWDRSKIIAPTGLKHLRPWPITGATDGSLLVCRGYYGSFLGFYGTELVLMRPRF